MDRKWLESKGIEKNIVEEIMALYGEERSKDKNSYEELKKQLESAQSDIKIRDNQISELSKIDPAKLEETIKILQEQNKQTEKEYAEKLKFERIQNAIDKALLKNGAKNSKAVSALLDKEKLIIEEDGTVKGLEEQFKTLLEGKDTAFLFETKSPSNSQLKGGFLPGSSGSTPPSVNPFAADTFNVEEQGRLFRENPTEAKRLANEVNYEI